ncbi:hypothetical protein [uncultured Winogradskyella sp.]|uniref:hypothetical protein n=1 Tax=uncultured Winogradskyella sp. TaxID=395353 RepID=UPI00263A1FCF|nr:hypothetical protein [uncultured Winogradskyella sp.]
MKLKFFLLFTMSLLTLASCSDSASDEFEDSNPDGVARYIETIETVSAQDASENATITVNYDGNGRVSSITDGEESSLFIYSNNQLTNISGQGDNFNIEELYQSPYDAFETGVVNEYVNNNPVNITFYEYEYDFMSNTEVEVEYTAEITYDSQPNPYFYTLDAAGLVDVMDNVDLNFSMNPSSPEIIQARALFPVNNISGITYRDEDGTVVYEIEADYVYNSDNYPTSGTVTATYYEEDDYNGETYTETSIYSLSYTYRE